MDRCRPNGLIRLDPCSGSSVGVVMYRINPETGEVLVPHLFEDGTYGAANPKFGKTRHHITNRVIAANIDVLREYFPEGWPIWMSIRGTRDRRLISNGITNADP